MKFLSERELSWITQHWMEKDNPRSCDCKEIMIEFSEAYLKMFWCSINAKIHFLRVNLICFQFSLKFFISRYMLKNNSSIWLHLYGCQLIFAGHPIWISIVHIVHSDGNIKFMCGVFMWGDFHFVRVCKCVKECKLPLCIKSFHFLMFCKYNEICLELMTGNVGLFFYNKI